MKRPLGGLVASAVVHGALVAVVLSNGSRAELPPLFVDLTEERAAAPRGRSDGARPRQPASRAVAATRAPRPAPPAPIERRASPSPDPAPAPTRTLVPEPVERPTESGHSTESARSTGWAGTAEARGEPDFGVSALAPGAIASSRPGGSGGASGDIGTDSPQGADTLGARPGQGLALAIPGMDSGTSSNEPGAEYGGYLARLRQQVQEALRYPASARRRGLGGTVHVELTILPSGAIGSVVVVGSSSHEVLDDAAVRTIRNLRPMPFPSDLPARRLRVRLPVVFQLE